MDNETKVNPGEQPKRRRTFAKPKTADEAEVLIPPIELLAAGVELRGDKNHRWKTREEILRDGTLKDKLRLLFASMDTDSYFNTKGKLTKEDTIKIASSIRVKEEEELLEQCYKEYKALVEYGRQVSYFFKLFQISFSTLALLINQWESYEQRAEEYTRLYRSTKNHVGSLADEAFTAAVLKNVIKDSIKGAMFDGASLYFDYTTNSFKVKVDGKGGLYSQIKAEAKETAKSLSNFKAYVVAAEEYVAVSTLRYMPISIQTSSADAEEEYYERYLVKNDCYFRSYINDKKFFGETITPEEELKAVIPDYAEVEPSKLIYKDAKRWLSELLNIKIG